MTTVRLIPFPVHGALEFLLGLALGVAPFLLGLSPAATATALVAGVLVAGLALGAATADAPRSPSVAAHHSYDYGIAFGLLGGAVVFALGGDGPAVAVLGLAAVAQFALNLTTRYSLRA